MYLFYRKKKLAALTFYSASFLAATSDSVHFWQCNGTFIGINTESLEFQSNFAIGFKLASHAKIVFEQIKTT